MAVAEAVREVLALLVLLITQAEMVDFQIFQAHHKEIAQVAEEGED